MSGSMSFGANGDPPPGPVGCQYLHLEQGDRRTSHVGKLYTMKELSLKGTTSPRDDLTRVGSFCTFFCCLDDLLDFRLMSDV